jgi:hypothetical protein
MTGAAHGTPCGPVRLRSMTTRRQRSLPPEPRAARTLLWAEPASAPATSGSASRPQENAIMVNAIQRHANARPGPQQVHQPPQPAELPRRRPQGPGPDHASARPHHGPRMRPGVAGRSEDEVRLDTPSSRRRLYRSRGWWRPAGTAPAARGCNARMPGTSFQHPGAADSALKGRGLMRTGRRAAERALTRALERACAYRDSASRHRARGAS